MTKDSSLSSIKLRQLLIDLKENGTNTCVRWRLVGQMWQPYFMRVISVGENRILLHEEVKNKLFFVPLNSIMQIELDNNFKEFQPHSHYTIYLDRS